MKRKLLFGVVACWLLLSGGASVASEIHITLADCGEYRGFAGYITESGITVTFETCESATGSYTNFWDTFDALIANTIYTGDPEDITYYMAGIDVSGELTQAEKDAIDEVITSPEASLVDQLVPKLFQLGMGPKGLPMITLRANVVGFSRVSTLAAGPFCGTCRDRASNCSGCCGIGCWGCGDVIEVICTEWCYRHDECVAVWGHGHDDCVEMLAHAALSTITCSMDPNRAGCCGPQAPPLP